VTDGPFTEAKEVFGGYAIFELKSKKEAVERAVAFMELHKQHWPGWQGPRPRSAQQTFLNGKRKSARTRCSGRQTPIPVHRRTGRPTDGPRISSRDVPRPCAGGR